MIDKRLIQECQRNVRSAQRQVYDILLPKIYYTCKRYIENTTDIEDIMSDIFISIFTNIHQLQAPEAIVSWSRKIAVNRCMHFIKKNKIKYDEPENWELIVDETPFSTNSEDIYHLINQLPKNSKLIFNLSVVEGFSHKEISQLLDISEGTSKSQLSYAKNKLRTWLEKFQHSI